MNIINIKNSALAVMLLSSSIVGAETQYPAADFQPKVVYQDPDYKQSGPSTASSASASDSQYPAANFQPKVVYNDPDYKHSQTVAAAPSTTQSASEPSSNSNDSDGAKAESSSNYLIGLVVLALVGVVLFKKKSKTEVREPASGQGASKVSSGSSSGLTGVAKYINRKAGTGVSRYLEKAQSATSSSAVTGVAKYMAKQAEAAKSTATHAATGVEKYMRNRG